MKTATRTKRSHSGDMAFVNPPAGNGSSAALLLFARAPVPGRVKTRLAAAIGAAAAASLYRAFLEDASGQYARIPGIVPVLAGEPTGVAPEFDGLFQPPWRRRDQGEGDLGDRLCRAFEEEFAAGARWVGVVGSDHPSLPRASLLEAFRAAAESAGAAVIPAADGGFCLLVLPRGASPELLFRGIPWSTDRTFCVLADRAKTSGLPIHVLDGWYDVDRAEDLLRLRKDLESRDEAAPDFPAATQRWLSSSPQVLG
jgi:uncharacterized protein